MQRELELESGLGCQRGPLRSVWVEAENRLGHIRRSRSLGDVLEEQGVSSFAKSFDELITALDTKSESLR